MARMGIGRVYLGGRKRLRDSFSRRFFVLPSSSSSGSLRFCSTAFSFESMKKSFISVGLCFVCFWGAYGQAAVTGSATARSKPLAYVVGERGPNEKTWYEI